MLMVSYEVALSIFVLTGIVFIAVAGYTYAKGHEAGGLDVAHPAIMRTESEAAKSELAASRLGKELATAKGQLAFAQAKLEAWADHRASETVKAVLGSGPYIVLPSLAFDVLPVELCNRLTAVLQEAEDMGVNWPTGYNVVRRGKGGRAVKDAWNAGFGFEQANGGPLKAGAGDQP